MDTLQGWLAGSWLFGWILRLPNTSPWFDGSFIVNVWRRLRTFIYNLFRNSIFFYWAVPGTAVNRDSWSEINAYDSSVLARGGRAFSNWCFRLFWAWGQRAKELTAASFVWQNPLMFLGIVLFLYSIFNILLNQPSGKHLIAEIVLALAGLLMAILRPSMTWLENSFLAKIFRSWRGEDSSKGPVEGLSWADLSLYLIVSYVVIDYFLRSFSPLAFLTGIWDELLLIIIVGFWIIKVGIHKISPPALRFFIPYLLYCGVFVFLFLINSPEKAPAIEGFRVYIEYVLWYFVGVMVLSNKSQFKWVCDIFLLVAFAVALYGVYQYLIGVELPANWIDSKFETTLRTRVFSIIGSPNVLGSLMAFAVPFGIGAFFSTRSLGKKSVYFVITAVMAACIVFTFSRGAWLGLIVGIIFLGLWLDRRIILGMIIIAFLTPLAMPSVFDRVAYMVTPEYAASSERGGRMGRWDKTVDYWATSPTIGVGLGRFGGAVAARYFPDDSFYVDNFYLKTGVESGWLGLAAFLLLVLAGLRLARSSLDDVEDRELLALGHGIMAGLLAVLAHNAGENIFEVPMMTAYFWFFLGLLAALQRVAPGGENAQS